jgi:hypothetical protein
LNFTSGGNLASVRDELNSSEVKSFVLRAESGQVLSVQIWSPNGDVFLGISSSDGKELLNTSAKAIRWTGAVSNGQDYIFTVIATGGGAVLDPKNRELMAKSGAIICLEAKVDTIYRRLIADTSSPGPLRPLLSGENPLQRIEQLKQSRQPYYSIANGKAITGCC